MKDNREPNICICGYCGKDVYGSIEVHYKACLEIYMMFNKSKLTTDFLETKILESI